MDWLNIFKKLANSIQNGNLEEIFICPSHNCNANCIHCYEKFIHGKYNNELSSQQIKSVIDQFKFLNGRMVHFCSGEFLLREDSISLIKYAREKIPEVSITSNGIILDKNKIYEVYKAGLTQLVCSIDNSDHEIHDSLRRVSGCFDKAVNALRNAKKLGIKTQIWTYVTKSNFEDLENIGKLGKDIGVDMIFVFFTLLSGHFFNKFEENLSYEEREFLRKKYNNHHLIRLEFPTEQSFCTGGGIKHISVMPSGDVTFCPPVPYSYGNINSKTLKKCLDSIREDFRKFCFTKCTGQCIINFPEYRKNNSGIFMYEQQ